MMKAQAEQQGDTEFDPESVKGKIEAQLQRDKVIDFMVEEGKVTITFVDKSMEEIAAEIENASVDDEADAEIVD